LAFGLRWRGIDLSGADGLHAGRNRLEESATKLAAKERWLSAEKFVVDHILGRHNAPNL
jgi:hypothetical protein